MAGECNAIGHVWVSQGGQWACSECGATSYRTGMHLVLTDPALALRVLAHNAGRGAIHDAYEAAADAVDRMEDDDVDDA